MYGLPKDIDLKFFEQQELLQICVGRREVILNFASALTLTVQSRFACSGVNQPNPTELPLSASGLLPLIGAHVVAAEGTSDGTLKLKFSNGDDLVVYDDDPNYESYVITRNGETIVIV
jgi:Family of unknown function (DUF6188)